MRSAAEQTGAECAITAKPGRELRREIPTAEASSSARLAFSGFSLRCVQAVTSFVTVIVLARTLGPAGRGEYFIFIAALAVLTRVADLGMSPAAVVFAGRYPHARSRIHGLLIRLMLSLWLSVGVLGATALWLTGVVLPWPAERSVLGLLILPLLIYEQIWIHLMVGMRRVVPMNLVQLGGGFLSVGLVSVLVASQSVAVTTALVVVALVAVGKAVVMFSIAVRATRANAEQSSGEYRTWDMVAFGLRGYPNSLALLLWTRLPGSYLAQSMARLRWACSRLLSRRSSNCWRLRNQLKMPSTNG
ncbi:MAG: lipopolysaccharide biosynthesis protein [Chloroflexota bacterium]